MSDIYDNPKGLPTRPRRSDEGALPPDVWRVHGFENKYAVKVSPCSGPEVYRFVRSADYEERLAAVSLKPYLVNGYLQVTLCDGSRRRSKYIHVIAWESVMGYFGPHQIDHLNGDGTDNRFSNTQPVSGPEHQLITTLRNLQQGNPKSSTGRFHVYRTRPDAYEVRFSFNRKMHRSRTFKNIDDALAWRRCKAVEVFGYHPYREGT